MGLYFIALITPEDINQEIKSLKEEVKAKYGLIHALKLPAHITLQKPFKAETEKEREIKIALQNFSKDQSPFEIKISGFGRFDQRAIFAEVANKQPVTELFERMQNLVFTFVNKKDRQEDIYPHLTIATRDLDHNTFPRVWIDFKDRKYEASFTAGSLSLLKHNGKIWDILMKHDFAEGS